MVTINGRTGHASNCKQPAEKCLARRSDQDGSGECQVGIEVAQQCPVVIAIRTLCEAKARVEDDLLNTDASVDDRCDAAAEFTPNVDDDVVIRGALLHVGTVASPMHDD